MDYAVRHRLQAVKERRKLWETLAAVRVHARDAVVDAFVYVVSMDTNHETCQETMKSA